MVFSSPLYSLVIWWANRREARRQGHVTSTAGLLAFVLSYDCVQSVMTSSIEQSHCRKTISRSCSRRKRRLLLKSKVRYRIYNSLPPQCDTYERQTSVSPAGFEPAIPASERPHTDTLDRGAIGIAGLLLGIKLFCDSLVMLIKYPTFIQKHSVHW